MLLDAVTTSFLVCHDRQKSMLRVQITVALAVLISAWLTAPYGPIWVAVVVGSITAAMSLVYGAMVVRLSKAGTEAIVDLFKTSAPPVIGVVLAITLLDFFAPGLGRERAVLWGLVAAIFGFLIGVYGVRARMLTAIGSLGHLREVTPNQAQQ
jgi:hypothetical protein